MYGTDPKYSTAGEAEICVEGSLAVGLKDKLDVDPWSGDEDVPAGKIKAKTSSS